MFATMLDAQCCHNSEGTDVSIYFWPYNIFVLVGNFVMLMCHIIHPDGCLSVLICHF